MNRNRSRYANVASASGDASGSNPARPRNRSASGAMRGSDRELLVSRLCDELLMRVSQ
jgi:hypothetical protein